MEKSRKRLKTCNSLADGALGDAKNQLMQAGPGVMSEEHCGPRSAIPGDCSEKVDESSVVDAAEDAAEGKQDDLAIPRHAQRQVLGQAGAVGRGSFEVATAQLHDEMKSLAGAVGCEASTPQLPDVSVLSSEVSSDVAMTCISENAATQVGEPTEVSDNSVDDEKSIKPALCDSESIDNHEISQA